eukprot:TRINITY_DN68617_c0_g1_i1.p1 TRINITY_DN68617_c0_g1~~TRINITY_DN68617_c0_g1_i1.p1  ORF type:complete len:128 (-),score=22.81 TRINITY_DN68617_c0_g1_i1:40-423(-)
MACSGARLPHRPPVRRRAVAALGLFGACVLGVGFCGPTRGRIMTQAGVDSREVSTQLPRWAAANNDDETVGDKVKAAWESDQVKNFIAFVAAVSTAWDLYTLFTGGEDAGVSEGAGRALEAVQSSAT